jgi:hypothetical protein
MAKKEFLENYWNSWNGLGERFTLSGVTLWRKLAVNLKDCEYASSQKLPSTFCSLKTLDPFCCGHEVKLSLNKSLKNRYVWVP